MIDIKQFASLQKNSSRSFHQQKAIIKKLMAGQQVLCQCCQQPLQLHLPNGKNENEASTICCKKGCTDIQLDFS